MESRRVIQMSGCIANGPAMEEGLVIVCLNVWMGEGVAERQLSHLGDGSGACAV